MVSRRTKITLIVVFALVATLAAIAVAAHILVSRQDHELIKREIASRVQASTGFELQINGSFELPYSLLPTVDEKNWNQCGACCQRDKNGADYTSNIFKQ